MCIFGSLLKAPVGSGLYPAGSVAFVVGRWVSRHPPPILLPSLELFPPVNSSLLLEGRETCVYIRVLHRHVLRGLGGAEGVLCCVCVEGTWQERTRVPPRPTCM